MNKKYENIRVAMAHRRERLAEEIYEVNEILCRAAKAAAQGFSRVRITVDPPVGLRQTKAAERAEAELVEMGFEVSWQARHVDPDSRKNESFCHIDLHEMVIGWEGSSSIAANMAAK